MHSRTGGEDGAALLATDTITSPMSRISFLSHSRNPALYRRDPSFFYRCENRCDALPGATLPKQQLHRKDYQTSGTSGEIVVCHRPCDSWRWRLWHEKLRRSGAKLVAEVDDLIFDPTLAAHSPAVRNRHLSVWRTKWLFAANRRALARFDFISASTDPLAAELQRCFPRAQVGVFPNCLPFAWASLPLAPADQRTLTYLPGTRGHNADFAMIAGPVRQFLLEHPDWHLLVAGPLDVKLEVAPHQLRRLERVPFDRYHEIVQSGTINLAPLEDSPFNRCKSALKIMEAGFFGIPTVASPIPDARRFAGEGLEFATSSDEWLDALRRLAGGHPYPASWREDLRQRIVRHASIEKEAERWLEWLGLPPN